LQLSELSPTGETRREISKMHLDGLPTRPKGVTRLEIVPNFKSNTELIIKICDLGFGDLFPQENYEREFLIKI
jgi:hypothetical protein